MHIHERNGDVVASWDAKAEEWDRQVGEEGDANRRHNSDPVLHRMLGPVEGLDVLDAGCGTGYLSRRLARLGARVVSVDISERMVGIARAHAERAGLAIDARVASCTSLEGMHDASMDLVVSNYVLMDLDDMPGAVRAFHRVLRPGGRAVLVFSHPCFSPPDGGFGRMLDGSVLYRWGRSYFDQYDYIESWGNFTTSFVGFHRPLSAYWRTMCETGFTVLEFDEPAAQYPSAADASTPELDAAAVARMRTHPNSVAFHLLKPTG